MAARPKLRPVASSDASGAVEAPTQSESSPRTGLPAWAPTVLGVALVVALVLLVWSRVQLGGEIATLGIELRALEERLVSRDRVISVQADRISAARQGLGELEVRIGELRTTLSKPVPAVE